MLGSRLLRRERVRTSTSRRTPTRPRPTPASHYLSPGSYFWYVDAYDSSNHLIGSTSPADYGQFTIKDLPAASGQKVALDGLASASNSAGCTNALSAPLPANQLCTGVPATPFLSWDAESHAAGYAIYLAQRP